MRADPVRQYAAAAEHRRRVRSCRMKLVIKSCLFSCFFLALAGGCGSDDSKAACEAIIEACHPVDPGSGPIHECHENAESKWSNDQCTSMSAGCLAMCKAVDGGAHD
jgi:hypothetical protein